MKTNYHTHCYFCDGADDPESYVAAALKKGFSSLGFSSHAPVPFETDWTMKEENLAPYLERINSLKELYQDRIEIYRGLEIDYIRNLTGPSSPKFQNIGLDYRLGSIHFIQSLKSGRYLTLDGPAEEFEELLEVNFNNNIRKMISHFYELLRLMLSEHKFDIVSHFDLYKAQNRGEKYFDENSLWHKDEIMQTLELISGKDVIIEVNTGGWARGKTEYLYPSRWILKQIHSLHIPVTINTDAHKPDLLDAFYDKAVDELKELGFTEYMILKNGSWMNRPI